jgi:hypothetical protein
MDLSGLLGLDCSSRRTPELAGLRAREDRVILRRDKPETVDVARDATEAICVEAFQPLMRRAVERGERLPRDAEMVMAFPQFWVLAIPMVDVIEREKGVNHGD